MAVTEQMNNEKAKKENLANDIKSYLERIKEIINKKIPDTLKKMRQKILAKATTRCTSTSKVFPVWTMIRQEHFY